MFILVQPERYLHGKSPSTNGYIRQHATHSFKLIFCITPHSDYHRSCALNKREVSYVGVKACLAVVAYTLHS